MQESDCPAMSCDQNEFSKLNWGISVSCALQKNNNGVRCFQLGGVDTALAWFQQALVESKKNISEQRQMKCFCSQPSASKLSSGSNNPNGGQQRRIETSRVLIGQTDCRLSVVEDSEAIFLDERYQKTFVLFVARPTHTPHTTAVKAMINLATCHYWKGLYERSRGNLDSAVRLYELAYEMITLEESKETISPNLLLATVNNLGIIHQILGDRCRSEKCFETLLKLLVFFSMDNNRESLELTSDVRESYFGNTLSLILKDPQYAAAA